MVEPENLVNCALYLSSDEACRVTGTELVVDAGMSL
ncbi:SDR family oxidoreductase [Bacillus litorisediminis]